MIIEPPLHRLHTFGQPTASELATFLALGDEPTTFERGETIRSEGIEPTGFFLQISGWVAASLVLPDGGRQILKVHLPGDALGTPSMAVTRTVECLSAITRATVSAVNFRRFGKLLEEHPRVAAHLLLGSQIERIALIDRLASLGRTSALARVSAFLSDIVERLEPIGLVKDDAFMLPMTQEEIGDATGLTNVYVSRTLRNLEGRMLIERNGREIRILDRKALSNLAARPVRVPVKNPPWLPAPR